VTFESERCRPRVRLRAPDTRQAAKADAANTAVRPHWVLSCILRGLVAAVPLMPAVKPAAATSTIQVADGTWLVQARVNSGSRYCSDRLVRLTNRHGELSGSVAFARASAPIDNLVLLPDGSFSGATRGGAAGSKLGRFYKVTGKVPATRSVLPWKVLGVLLVAALPPDAGHAAEAGTFSRSCRPDLFEGIDDVRCNASQLGSNRTMDIANTTNSIDECWSDEIVPTLGRS